MDSSTNTQNNEKELFYNKYGSVPAALLIILGNILVIFSSFTYDNITLFIIGIVPGVILIVVGFYMYYKIVKALKFYNYYARGANNLQSLSDIYMISKSSLKQELESLSSNGLIQKFEIDEFENIKFIKTPTNNYYSNSNINNNLFLNDNDEKEAKILDLNKSQNKQISHKTYSTDKNIIINEEEISEQVSEKYKGINNSGNIVENSNQQIEDWKKYLDIITKAESDFKSEDIAFSLYELHATLNKLLMYLDKHKEKAVDLKKLMDFHLPSSLKLIDSYKELSKSGIHSFSVNKTKEDIVSAIDKINEAFKGVLEDLYNDTAIDVSSDITVLKMMLAREGFLDRDTFKIKK